MREQTLPQNLPQEEAFLQQLTQTVCRWGLKLPTLLTLQAGPPLTFLAAQCLWIAQPACALLFPRTQTVQQVAQLLENPAQLTRFRHLLEQAP